MNGNQEVDDLDIFRKLPKKHVDGFSLWRLGIFRGASFELVELRAGEIQPEHYHQASDAVLHFIRGEGTIILNGESLTYKAGDVFDVPRKMTHGFKAQTHSLFLSIQNPPIRNQETGIEDIIFLEEARQDV